MTATVEDPFAVEDVGPPRDRYGRSLLIPKGKKERVPYTRASGMASYMCDDFGLATYKRRLAAIGLARREDLCALIAALPPLNDTKRDKASLTRAEREQDADTKKKLDSYLDMAHEAADGLHKAHMGTAIHGFMEKGSADGAPECMVPDIQSALDTLDRRDIKVMATEQFVANDDLMAAGTFDCLLDVPDLGVVIADYKSGQVAGKGLQFAIQLATYANGEVYDWHTDERAPLESLTGGLRVNRNVGIVLHVPLGGARTELYRIDLRRGQHLARLATHVRNARTLKDLMSPLPEES